MKNKEMPLFGKINNYLDNKSFGISSFLILIALLLDITCFIGVTINSGFNFISLFFLLFEVILHLTLIIGLLFKNVRLFNIMMVAVKVFDAVFFSFLIAERVQNIYSGAVKPQGVFEFVNLLSYGLSTILLLLILIFFIFNSVTGKHFYWKTMKLFFLITIIVMFFCSVAEIINFIKYSTYWFEFLEPFYMVFLMSGMLIICHYVEKDK